MQIATLNEIYCTTVQGIVIENVYIMAYGVYNVYRISIYDIKYIYVLHIESLCR